MGGCCHRVRRRRAVPGNARVAADRRAVVPILSPYAAVRYWTPASAGASTCLTGTCRANRAVPANARVPMGNALFPGTPAMRPPRRQEKTDASRAGPHHLALCCSTEHGLRMLRCTMASSPTFSGSSKRSVRPRAPGPRGPHEGGSTPPARADVGSFKLLLV